VNFRQAEFGSSLNFQFDHKILNLLPKWMCNKNMSHALFHSDSDGWLASQPLLHIDMPPPEQLATDSFVS
jgi:hypothetical protein